MLLPIESDRRVGLPRFHQRADGRYFYQRRPHSRIAMVLGDYHSPLPRQGSRRRGLERRLAAILGADIMDYSALMERNEEEAHQRVGAELERFRREIERSNGRVFIFAGDGLLAECQSGDEALKCGLRVQAESSKGNARLPADLRI